MKRLFLMVAFHLNNYILFSYKQLSQKNPDELNHREICVFSLGFTSMYLPKYFAPSSQRTHLPAW